MFFFSALSANLALFRESPNVGQSSKLYSTTGPEHATDGRIDSKNVALHSITGAISADPDPYWFVKLDDMYLVQTVEVFRRKDCCFYKAGTLKVLVGMVYEAVRLLELALSVPSFNIF